MIQSTVIIYTARLFTKTVYHVGQQLDSHTYIRDRQALHSASERNGTGLPIVVMGSRHNRPLLSTRSDDLTILCSQATLLVCICVENFIKFSNW